MRELSHKYSHTWTREEPQRREAQREDGQHEKFKSSDVSTGNK